MSKFCAWQTCKEPVCKFLACLEQHALVRELSSSTFYWVCAYANNQHCVEEDIRSNPRSTSFYRAMQMSQGVLLVLDSSGTPFERIWCCFEEAIAAALENTWQHQVRLTKANIASWMMHQALKPVRLRW